MKPILTIRYLIYSQACFYVGIVLCFIIKPIGLFNNAGISFYGTIAVTLLPYLLALIGSAFFFIRYALTIDSREDSVTHYAFILFGLFIIGLAMTPYTAGRYISDLHLTFGSSLFALQLLFSFWIIVRVSYAYWAIILTSLEFIAGYASFLYLTPKHGYLTETQFLYQIAFGALVMYTFRLSNARSIAHADKAY